MKQRAGDLLFRTVWSVGLTLALAWATLVLAATAYSFLVISADPIGGGVAGLLMQSHPLTLPLLGLGLVGIAARISLKRRRLSTDGRTPRRIWSRATPTQGRQRHPQ